MFSNYLNSNYDIDITYNYVMIIKWQRRKVRRLASSPFKHFNRLPDSKTVELFNLKAFADEKVRCKSKDGICFSGLQTLLKKEQGKC